MGDAAIEDDVEIETAAIGARRGEIKHQVAVEDRGH
jgi:hypothetical protein